MKHEFWLKAWQDGRTGFHRATPLPWLLKYWPTLNLPADSRVLVPLCGMSPALAWLAGQGHQILGVELSPLAIERFFDAHDLTPTVHESPAGKHHVAGSIEIIEGDVLDLDDATLASCAAIYDRAAIVALPGPLRTRYVERVYGRLPASCKGLLITLEYDQREMNGPPFSVNQAMAENLLGHCGWQIEACQRQDVLASEPKFAQRGLTALHTGIYRLHRSA